jgi:hypothetical protein
MFTSDPAREAHVFAISLDSKDRLFEERLGIGIMIVDHHGSVDL